MSDSTEQARAQLATVIEQVAALECDFDRLEELEDARAPYAVNNNTFGYMPDNEPALFDTAEDAQAFLVRELERCAEDADEQGNKAVADDYTRLMERLDVVEPWAPAKPLQLLAADGVCFALYVDENEGLSLEEHEELCALRKAAGDCENREAAEQRIHENALSVEVRESAWRTVGAEPMGADQFRIVLCTGGPHVQISGELGAHGEPELVGLESAEWFSGLEPLPLDDDERDALQTFAEQFYFGE